MCGITGFLAGSATANDQQLAAVVSQMADTLHHRGPDDTGVWTDASAGLALGHKRLAIIDLSPAGHQPMHSADGRLTIVYNGEIYNYQQLRAQLAARGHRFRGRSDTEVLLAAVCQWGLAEALRRSIGMFALALWDRQQRRLALARDRIGIKPLYYGWQGKTLLFGSELKALRAHPDFRGQIDRDALALYVRHNYVPSPFSIYGGIRKLPPGTILEVRAGAEPERALPAPYWDARAAARRGTSRPFAGSADEAVGALDQLLRDAVHCRMYADVPLGAFLSGGIDSSTTVALMQAQSARPVRTFSIGFAEAEYNEAEDARAVAEHLGTEHTEWYVSPQDARDVIPRLPAMFDEPFADSSQIPTFLVSQLARRHVTVSLSGDGGDELFGGYRRYFTTLKRWRALGRIPARRALAGVLDRLAPPPAAGRLARKTRTLADLLSTADPTELYAQTICHWHRPADVVIGADVPDTIHLDYDRWQARGNLLEQMMFVDSVTYLPDDILVKVDRASMAVALEARVPLLDHRVVEFAWTVGPAMKVRGGQSKWLLRQVLDRYVPRRLIDRPKTGFGVPIDHWLRGPLRDWAEALLDRKRLADEGFLRPEPIRAKWQEHLAGSCDWHFQLWDILMFQAWLEAERGDQPPCASRSAKRPF